MAKPKRPAAHGGARKGAGRKARVEGGSTLVGLRVPNVELDIWTDLAATANQSLSEWMRDAINRSTK